ncbi:calcium/sodium antiporter [Pseudaeromonas paramecii]|uniref:Calcium/sodium antiporter n=1 Tax=Pseudaeromonas paramecii TaxID=2138166 RepID=A0ABP8QH88_9GAMM
MLLAAAAMLAGLILLVWSADKFVDGAALTARYAGMPPLLIGMVIIGFGTSAPELTVSALAAWQGNPGLALGNAFGSNIANIGLILGLTALLGTLTIASNVVRREFPILLAITLLAGWPLLDGVVSRSESCLLLGVFGLIMAWSIRAGLKERDVLGDEVEAELGADAQQTSLGKALFWLVLGLLLLIASSRLLVWGAVAIASSLGVSDLIIGLTIVAVGTSLPELASSIMALRKGEHDMALGNVLGSNLFNTLAVVGIAGVINPIAVPAEVLSRDWAIMLAVTVLLIVLGLLPRRKLGRMAGGLLMLSFIAYTALLVIQQLA